MSRENRCKRDKRFCSAPAIKELGQTNPTRRIVLCTPPLPTPQTPQSERAASESPLPQTLVASPSNLPTQLVYKRPCIFLYLPNILISEVLHIYDELSKFMKFNSLFLSRRPNIKNNRGIPCFVSATIQNATLQNKSQSNSNDRSTFLYNILETLGLNCMDM